MSDIQSKPEDSQDSDRLDNGCPNDAMIWQAIKEIRELPDKVKTSFFSTGEIMGFLSALTFALGAELHKRSEIPYAIPSSPFAAVCSREEFIDRHFYNDNLAFIRRFKLIEGSIEDRGYAERLRLEEKYSGKTLRWNEFESGFMTGREDAVAWMDGQASTLFSDFLEWM